MVTFWDSSAIIPLIVTEPTSADMMKLARESDLLVWWSTAIECMSAISRREREASLSPEGATQSRHDLGFLRQDWSEILPSEQVRDGAQRLLLRHPLRAADALQLGAALRWSKNRPDGHRFISLDVRLATAARKEGFELVEL